MKNIQRQRILSLLQKYKGRWVSLKDILALGVAQYNARVYELRREGYRILNRTETVRDFFGGSVRHSYFMLEGRDEQFMVSGVGAPGEDNVVLFGEPGQSSV